MKHCPNCNFRTSQNNDNYCAICGARLQMVPNVSFCKHCGAELFPHAGFCTKCGAQPDAFGPSLSTTQEKCSGIALSVSVKVEDGTTQKKNDFDKLVQNVKSAPIRPLPDPEPRKMPELASATASSVITTCEVFKPEELTTKVVVDPPQTVQFVRGQGAPSSRILSRKEIRELGMKAIKVIPERVAHFAPLVGVNYRKITVQNYRNHWGICSCSKKDLNDNILKFNCLLMLAPPEVLDSVVVHELCHILQHDHSERFYAEVLRVLPDYWEKDKWLDDHNFLLENVEEGYVYRCSSGAPH